MCLEHDEKMGQTLSYEEEDIGPKKYIARRLYIASIANESTLMKSRGLHAVPR